MDVQDESASSSGQGAIEDDTRSRRSRAGRIPCLGTADELALTWECRVRDFPGPRQQDSEQHVVHFLEGAGSRHVERMSTAPHSPTHARRVTGVRKGAVSARMADVFYQGDRFTEALRALKTAVVLNPPQARCYRLLGSNCKRERLEHEAEEAFLAAGSIEPERSAPAESVAQSRLLWRRIGSRPSRVASPVQEKGRVYH